jgi:AcrR family transcriptional regulator
MAAERKSQITAAALRVLATYGITGVTLERIAEEAGMARGHVRHYAGNRDAILTEAAEHFYFDGTGGESFLPAEIATLAHAIDFLFGEEFTKPGGDNDVVKGYLVEARTNPDIAAITNKAYRGAQRALEAMISDAKPRAATDDVARVAYGILTIALGNVFMEELTPAAHLTDSARAAAEQLLETL